MYESVVISWENCHNGSLTDCPAGDWQTALVTALNDLLAALARGKHRVHLPGRGTLCHAIDRH